MAQLPRFSRVAPLVAALVALSAVATFADHDHDREHLDRHETRRLVRRLDEQSNVLQDRIDDWIDERGKERTHLAEELNHRLDHFENAVIALRSGVLSHDDPWDIRDNAKAVIDAAIDLHAGLEHADYLPRESWREWDGLRGHVNDLARLYHLEPIGER